MQRLYETIDDGFRGVHSRLDVLNGRTVKGEISDAEIRTGAVLFDRRLTNVEDEIFAHPQRRVADIPPESATKRESAIVVLGLAVMTVLVKIAFVLGESAIEAIKAALRVK